MFLWRPLMRARPGSTSTPSNLRRAAAGSRAPPDTRLITTSRTCSRRTTTRASSCPTFRATAWTWSSRRPLATVTSPRATTRTTVASRPSPRSGQITTTSSNSMRTRVRQRALSSYRPRGTYTGLTKRKVWCTVVASTVTWTRRAISWRSSRTCPLSQTSRSSLILMNSATGSTWPFRRRESTGPTAPAITKRRSSRLTWRARTS
mmetsp:Transcript_97183/g.278186  ORF Transcript_97183/g.278186 Transcript_97183/m.278186 type:complete len:205 (+) Transcript_97183:556-1170(+)